MPLQTIETFIQFKEYFKGFKDTLGIKDFVFGDSTRILNAQNSVLDYPVLWLHTPDIKPYESGGRKNRFTSDFLILKAAAVDDYDQQESNFNDCLEIVWKVLRKMERDAETGIFDFDIDSADIQPKSAMSADNMNGWFVTFSMSTPGCSDECCDDD